MSDLKMTCPGCGSHSSNVGMDYSNDEPCRSCGLPAEATTAILAARRTAADHELVIKYQEAITRATRAEAEAERLSRLLIALRDLLDNFGGSGETPA